MTELVIVSPEVRLSVPSLQVFEKPKWMKKLMKDQTIPVGEYVLQFEGVMDVPGASRYGKDLIMSAQKKGGNANLQHALALLGNPHLIPAELRSERYLVFADALGVNSFTRRPTVACLYWTGIAWVMNWQALTDKFGSHDRIVRARRG
jgi:hypothetical protein